MYHGGPLDIFLILSSFVIILAHSDEDAVSRSNLMIKTLPTYYSHSADTEGNTPRDKCLYCNDSGYLEINLHHKHWDLGFICSKGFPDVHPPTTPCIVLFRQPVTILFHEFYVEFQDKVTACEQSMARGFTCRGGSHEEEDPRKTVLWTLRANHLLNLTMTQGQRESDGWLGGRKGFNITFEAGDGQDYYPGLKNLGQEITTPFSCYDSGYPVIQSVAPRIVTSECKCLEGSSGDLCQYGATCTSTTATSYCNDRGLCSERQRGKFVLCHCYLYNNTSTRGPPLNPPLFHLNYYGGPRCELPHTAFYSQNFSAECVRKGVCPHQCHLVSDPEQQIRVYCSQPPDVAPRTCAPRNHTSQGRDLHEVTGNDDCSSDAASSNNTAGADQSHLAVGPLSWRHHGDQNRLVVTCPASPCRPEYHFRWMLDGELIPTFHNRMYTIQVDACTSELHIERPATHEYGMYECEVEHCSHRVKMGVLVDPRSSKGLIMPQEVTVRRGGSATLRCIGLNRPRLWMNDFSLTWHTWSRLAHVSPGDEKPRWQEYLEPIDLPQEGPWQWQWKEKSLHVEDIIDNLTLNCIIGSFNEQLVQPLETFCQPIPKSFDPSVFMNLGVDSMASVTIRVLGLGILACEEEGQEELRTFWPLTETGREAVQRCPVGFIGYAKRKCMQVLNPSPEERPALTSDQITLSPVAQSSTTNGTAAPQDLQFSNATIQSSARAVWAPIYYSDCLDQSLLNTSKIISRVETVFISFTSCDRKVRAINHLTSGPKVRVLHLPGGCDRLVNLLHSALVLPVTNMEQGPCDYGTTGLEAVSLFSVHPTCVTKSLSNLHLVFQYLLENWRLRSKTPSFEKHFPAFTVGAIGNSSYAITSTIELHLNDTLATTATAEISVYPTEGAETLPRILAFVTIFKAATLIPLDIASSLEGLVGPLSLIEFVPRPRVVVRLQMQGNVERSESMESNSLVCKRRSVLWSSNWSDTGCTKQTSKILASRIQPNVSSKWGVVFTTEVSTSPSQEFSIVCECDAGGYLGVFELQPSEDGRTAQYVLPPSEGWRADALVCSCCALSAAVLLLLTLVVHCCNHALHLLALASVGAFITVFVSFAVAAGVDTSAFVQHVAGLLLVEGLSVVQQVQLSCVMNVPKLPPYLAPTSSSEAPLAVKIATTLVFVIVPVCCLILLLDSRTCQLPSSYPYWLPRDTVLQAIILFMMMVFSLYWLYQLVVNGVAINKLSGKRESADLFIRLRGVLRRSAVLLASFWFFVLSSFAQYAPEGRYVFAGSALCLSAVKMAGIYLDQVEDVCLSSSQSNRKNGPCSHWFRNLSSKMAGKLKPSPTSIDVPLTEVTSVSMNVIRQKSNSVTSTASACLPSETNRVFGHINPQPRATSPGMNRENTSNRLTYDSFVASSFNVISYPQRRRYSTGTSLVHLYQELYIMPSDPPPPLFPRRPILNRSQIDLRSHSNRNGYEVMKPVYENTVIEKTVRPAVASVAHEHWGEILTTRTQRLADRSEDEDVSNIYTTLLPRYLHMSRTNNDRHADY